MIGTVTVRFDDAALFGALGKGAIGYLLKDAPAEALAIPARHSVTISQAAIFARLPFVTRAKLKALLEEYGRVALWTYLAIWLTVLGGFVLAISAGFEPSTAKGDAGALFSAWVATKLTQPLRIAATLGLTPLVASVVRRLRAKSP